MNTYFTEENTQTATSSGKVINNTGYQGNAN